MDPPLMSMYVLRDSIIGLCGVPLEFWRGMSSLRAQVQLPIMYSGSALALVLDHGRDLFVSPFISLYVTKGPDFAQSGGSFREFVGIRRNGCFPKGRLFRRPRVSFVRLAFRSEVFSLTGFIPFAPGCCAHLWQSCSKVVLFAIQTHGGFLSDSTPNDIMSLDRIE